MKKLGIIQSRGWGDVIIALPIAKYYADRGFTVVWPVSERIYPSFVETAPYVQFIPIAEDLTLRWLIQTPREILQSENCEHIFELEGYFEKRQDPVRGGLARIMPFDQYKFAIAQVPFAEKWNLQISRNREREEALYRAIVTDPNYVVAHLQKSTGYFETNLGSVAKGRPIVEIKPNTPSIFDWLTVIEKAAARIMVDSCFSNLTDQMKIPGEKYFIPSSEVGLNPVLLGDWRY